MKKIYLLLLFVSYLTYGQNPYQINLESVRDNAVQRVIKTSERSSLQNQLDCSDTSYLYCEDFESVSSPALPNDITTSSLETQYNVVVNSTAQNVNGFYTGNSDDANEGGFWPVEAHTQFAMTNDDACKPGGLTPNSNNNCDLSFETISLPMLDFTNENNSYLVFDFYHDKNYGGGDAVVEIKTGNQTNWTDISGNLPNLEGWQEGIFPLNDYSGMDSVFIRMKWSDDNKWASGFAVDNIVIKELQENVLKVVSYDHYLTGNRYRANYTQIPNTQIASPGVFFNGIIRNVGTNNQDSVRMKVEISSESYTTQSWAENIESLKRDTFTANLFFNTNTVGSYTVGFTAESDSTVSETVNRQIEVTEFIFARDNDDPTLRFSLIPAGGGAQTIEHGNAFYISQNIDLYAVDVFISANSYPNGKIQTKLYQLDNGTPIFLYESNKLSLINGIDTWQSIKFPQPFTLEQGNEYLVTVGGDGTITSDTTRIGGTSSREGSYGWRIYNGYTSPGSSSAAEDGIYLSIPMVRMNFDPNVAGPISVKEEELSYFSIYPNPNNGMFSISFDKNITEKSSIEIHNILGQLVYNEQLNENMISKDVNLSHLEQGIYTVSLKTNGENAQTQKVIIK